ncbi:hypothetical protein ACRRTK_019768 [Alexandromys fortis]
MWGKKNEGKSAALHRAWAGPGLWAALIKGPVARHRDCSRRARSVGLRSCPFLSAVSAGALPFRCSHRRTVSEVTTPDLCVPLQCGSTLLCPEPTERRDLPGRGCLVTADLPRTGRGASSFELQ